MMETIRSAASHIAVKIIFAIIILSFVFTGVGFLGFGGGTSARDEQQYIAKIDGEGLSRAAFEAQAREMTANVGALGGDASLITQLRRNVLSYQINNYLAYKFSKDLNASISNDRVKDAIREQAVFFENGKFSNKKYLDLLAANQYTPDMYAEVLRTALQQQQVIDALVNSTFVLPVDSELSLLKDQTRAIYATVINSSVVDMKDVVVSESDEQKYYDDHQNEFARKERIKFKYIANLKQDILPKVTITEDDIKKEYNNNTKEYSFPAKNAYSIIYVTNKDKADELVNQLKQGSDFETLAKATNANNEISPYGKNGSLGWFSDDDSLPAPFKDAELTKADQISKPIAVDGGYLIVKLDDIQKAKKMDFDSVKQTIRTKLATQKVDKIFEEQEKKLQSALANSSESLEKIAEKSGLNTVESDWTYFNDNGSIMRYSEVKDVAFGSDMLVDGKATGKLSDIIPVGQNQIDGGIIIQVVDYRPEGTAPFNEVQESIHQKLYNYAVNEHFKSIIDGIMTELNEKGQAKNIEFSKSYTLTRGSQELDKKVVDMVFDMMPSATGKNVFDVQFVDDKHAYIAKLTQVIPATQQKDISDELFPLIVNDTQYSLVTDLRTNAKIEIMPDSNL